MTLLDNHKNGTAATQSFAIGHGNIASFIFEFKEPILLRCFFLLFFFPFFFLFPKKLILLTSISLLLSKNREVVIRLGGTVNWVEILTGKHRSGQFVLRQKLYDLWKPNESRKVFRL